MPRTKGNTIHIIQGEFATASNPEQRISTLLGSCVSVCLWDDVAGLGGMNHMVLPEGTGVEIRSSSIGASAMELLINALLRRGAGREHLKAKMFGGASMVEGLSTIGEQNATFARDYLMRESIPLLAENVGGKEARQIRFWPVTGRVQMRWVGNPPVPIAPAPFAQNANDVELFLS